MNQIPEYMLLKGDHAAYRPEGVCTFYEVVDMIDGALSFCKARHIPALLVDIRRVSGFPPPTATERFHFATQWADTAGSRVALAMVSPPELIDPERIGITMATNRGLRCEVFTEESDAARWLGIADEPS